MYTKLYKYIVSLWVIYIQLYDDLEVEFQFHGNVQLALPQIPVTSNCNVGQMSLFLGIRDTLKQNNYMLVVNYFEIST